MQPPLPDLLDAYAGRDLAVKCAPGLDFDSLDWAGEVEVVSLDGGVREACLYSPGLSTPGVRRRAAVLRSDGTGFEITDAADDDIPEREPGEWIVDPDGAIVRAGLVRHYAAAHGLWQLDPRIAYLTGDSLPDGVRGFRIVERLKYSEKTLRQALARHDCGAVEILVRGVDVDPAVLRPRLKLRGSHRSAWCSPASAGRRKPSSARRRADRPHPGGCPHTDCGSRSTHVAVEGRDHELPARADAGADRQSGGGIERFLLERRAVREIEHRRCETPIAVDDHIGPAVGGHRRRTVRGHVRPFPLDLDAVAGVAQGRQRGAAVGRREEQQSVLGDGGTERRGTAGLVGPSRFARLGVERPQGTLPSWT